MSGANLAAARIFLPAFSRVIWCYFCALPLVRRQHIFISRLIATSEQRRQERETELKVLRKAVMEGILELNEGKIGGGWCVFE